MHDNKHPEVGAKAQENKAVFGIGMVRIVQKESVVIGEDGFGFFE